MLAEKLARATFTGSARSANTLTKNSVGLGSEAEEVVHERIGIMFEDEVLCSWIDEKSKKLFWQVREGNCIKMWWLHYELAAQDR